MIESHSSTVTPLLTSKYDIGKHNWRWSKADSLQEDVKFTAGRQQPNVDGKPLLLLFTTWSVWRYLTLYHRLNIRAMNNNYAIMWGQNVCVEGVPLRTSKSPIFRLWQGWIVVDGASIPFLNWLRRTIRAGWWFMELHAIWNTHAIKFITETCSVGPSCEPLCKWIIYDGGRLLASATWEGFVRCGASWSSFEGFEESAPVKEMVRDNFTP